MELISPTDSMFLLAESREHPMHVGGLQLFEPPEGAGPDFIRDIYATLVREDDVQPTFRKHPGELFGGIANLTWAQDRDIDLEYHLRRSALPSPGRVRELLELTSRLHGTLLDRHRPLWEAHLVEGLDDGRFAVYTKMHHALLDGVSAMRLMRRALSDDPQDTDLRAPDDTSSGGNAVGTILCSLATDLDDPAQRLDTIHASMRGNKEVFTQLPRLQQLALSAFNIAPLALALLPALASAAQPPFNIVISNVPGAREPLYWRGARLDGNYPMSIALDGQALNITLSNNADNLDFGLVGCRRSVPHLQRLLGHLEDSLTGLEEAVGV
jgi:hypothetical protein